MGVNQIDVFAHVLPPRFLAQMLQLAPDALDRNAWMRHPLLTDMAARAVAVPADERQVISAAVRMIEDDVATNDQLMGIQRFTRALGRSRSTFMALTTYCTGPMHRWGLRPMVRGPRFGRPLRPRLCLRWISDAY
ncbi:hypothetical protein [Lacticaseibacillus thailandensis]|uniref:Uncharacterized protein n=1 Tax=Lacticaseibacillus thailandensis DSM 22698 = JCM 13996 TaxID=1423810 RepID=A0A0R2C6F4_9LACO|nr:hypothetical protein [Lacticaseibacillus thailandensis]KRM87455.1 hypothetical protein FD19_GL000959 [Lacticaseibacillus thailandensis DSM 22698 = JCM 13996]